MGGEVEKDFSFLHNLTVISAHDQSFSALDPMHLWLLKTTQDGTEEVFGPYLERDLEKLIPHFRPELSQLLACNLSQKYWQPFFHYDCFDLRKKQHPSPPEITQDQHSFYYLFQGLKKGPATLEEISQLLQEGVIKADCLISTDQGLHWIRAYQLSVFDRRHKHQLTSWKPLREESLERSSLDKKQFDQSSGLLIAKENFLHAKQDLEQRKWQFHQPWELEKYKSFFFSLLAITLLFGWIYQWDSNSQKTTRSQRVSVENVQDYISKKYEKLTPTPAPPLAIKVPNNPDKLSTSVKPQKLQRSQINPSSVIDTKNQLDPIDEPGQDVEDPLESGERQTASGDRSPQGSASLAPVKKIIINNSPFELQDSEDEGLDVLEDFTEQE